jgi:hypothetical protein
MKCAQAIDYAKEMMAKKTKKSLCQNLIQRQTQTANSVWDIYYGKISKRGFGPFSMGPSACLSH